MSSLNQVAPERFAHSRMKGDVLVLRMFEYIQDHSDDPSLIADMLSQVGKNAPPYRIFNYLADKQLNILIAYLRAVPLLRSLDPELYSVYVFDKPVADSVVNRLITKDESFDECVTWIDALFADDSALYRIGLLHLIDSLVESIIHGDSDGLKKVLLKRVVVRITNYPIMTSLTGPGPALLKHRNYYDLVDPDNIQTRVLILDSLVRLGEFDNFTKLFVRLGESTGLLDELITKHFNSIFKKVENNPISINRLASAFLSNPRVSAFFKENPETVTELLKDCTPLLQNIITRRFGAYMLNLFEFIEQYSNNPVIIAKRIAEEDINYTFGGVFKQVIKTKSITTLVNFLNCLHLLPSMKKDYRYDSSISSVLAIELLDERVVRQNDSFENVKQWIDALCSSHSTIDPHAFWSLCKEMSIRIIQNDKLKVVYIACIKCLLNQPFVTDVSAPCPPDFSTKSDTVIQYLLQSLLLLLQIDEFELYTRLSMQLFDSCELLQGELMPMFIKETFLELKDKNDSSFIVAKSFLSKKLIVDYMKADRLLCIELITKLNAPIVKLIASKIDVVRLQLDMNRTEFKYLRTKGLIEREVAYNELLYGRTNKYKEEITTRFRELITLGVMLDKAISIVMGEYRIMYNDAARQNEYAQYIKKMANDQVLIDVDTDSEDYSIVLRDQIATLSLGRANGAKQRTIM